VIGRAPDCEFHVIKSLNDSASVSESWVLAGLDYVIDNNLDFLNLSWTFTTTAIEAAIQAVMDNGTVICAASGNDTAEDSAIKIPAGLNRVVAVNAVKEDGTAIYKNTRVSIFTNATHGISVACSGYGAEGYTNGGSYSGSNGTSFACPFFVGTLACYKEELQEENNFKVLAYALLRAKKTTQSTYFGAGIASF
jgi:subtilisin